VRLERLHAAMLKIAKDHKFTSDYLLSPTQLDALKTKVSDHMLVAFATIEAVAHEVAHALQLGGLCGSEVTRHAMGALSADDADQHELRALRIEYHALRRLGVTYDGENLREYAQWRAEKPPRGSVYTPLTPREQTMVNKMVSAVRDAEGRIPRELHARD
jgi:hypothetical protein